MATLDVQRIYGREPPHRGVYRVLVDRVWPRGVTKDAAAVDIWARDVAPSDSLRRWFGHDPEKWKEFERRYFAELDANPDAVSRLRTTLVEHPHVVLLYGARDEAHNNARALADYLSRR